MPRVTPFLWYDHQAEEAANFYASVFPNSRVDRVTRYPEGSPEGYAPGSVMTVEFELDGQPVIALNGGPHFRFNESFSFSVECASQEEVDYYWNALTAGGEESQCGWLKDRFGLSWQINPRQLSELLADADPGTSQRVMEAMLQMKKIDIAALERAAAGA